MSDCPLVRLANNRKILKKFEQIGKVAIPISMWPWFFDALTTIARDGGHREIHCAILEGYLVFSRTPIARRTAFDSERQELWDN
jgi:hypothetical protein